MNDLKDRIDLRLEPPVEGTDDQNIIAVRFGNLVLFIYDVLDSLRLILFLSTTAHAVLS